MNSPVMDVAVIGAGHAGLSISYLLKQLSFNHIVFEQGRIGNSWRNQRWDSFKLNTPNGVNLLPGKENPFSDAEGFCSAPEYASFLDSYCEENHLPVIENIKVLSVEKIPGSGYFSLCVSDDGSVRYFRSKQVVVSSGSQNKKNVPSFSKNISPAVFQLHAGEYRNASLLPEGSVLVVGSGQSGIQIAEDLVAKGRKVFLSTSQVPRVPRRYRGKDIVEWFNLTGFFDTLTNDISDPRILSIKQPQVSNSGLRGHTISLQSIARDGAVILGKMNNAANISVSLRPNAAAHVKFADEFSKNIKRMIDEYILKSLINAPLPDKDDDDYPDESASCATNITRLDLSRNHVGTIIWTTGFTGDFSYLKFPIFNEDGMPFHINGISNIAGLYFLGFPWLRKRKSGIIPGIREDAEFIAEQVEVHHTL